jgi:hypothetical protein
VHVLLNSRLEARERRRISVRSVASVQPSDNGVGEPPKNTPPGIKAADGRSQQPQNQLRPGPLPATSPAGMRLDGRDAKGNFDRPGNPGHGKPRLDPVRRASVTRWLGRAPNVFEELAFSAVWPIGQVLSAPWARRSGDPPQWPNRNSGETQDGLRDARGERTDFHRTQGSGECPVCIRSLARGSNYCIGCGRRLTHRQT